MFCPRCGFQRTGPVCTNCGFDFVEGAKTPTVTLSRGINWVSLSLGILALVLVFAIIWVALST